MFGSEFSGFLRPSNALLTLMGGLDGLLDEAALVSRTNFTGVLYYWAFVVVVVVLFLNIAVAILVDSYVSVKSADLARAPEEALLSGPAEGGSVIRSAHLHVQCSKIHAIIAVIEQVRMNIRKVI